MKTNQLIQACGSIVKTESLISIESHVLPNTCVAEANLPYANYYGHRPEKAVPNSIFLFTHFFYSLEEVLRFAQNTETCFMKNVDVATAVFNFSQKQMPAIRIKFFPDYEHLQELQSCFIKQGVVFEKKFQFENEALIRIAKCFVMEEIEKDILLDKKEADKGYVIFPKLLSYDQFGELIQQIRNNSSCRLFDAAKVSIILNSKLTDMARVYSEKLDIKLLKCLAEYFKKEMNHRSSISYRSAS